MTTEHASHDAHSDEVAADKFIEYGPATASRPPVSTDVLTPREATILSLIVQGRTNREAGKILDISTRTVEFHRANIMQKFGARNVADLMRMVLNRR